MRLSTSQIIYLLLCIYSWIGFFSYEQHVNGEANLASGALVLLTSLPWSILGGLFSSSYDSLIFILLAAAGQAINLYLLRKKRKDNPQNEPAP